MTEKVRKKFIACTFSVDLFFDKGYTTTIIKILDVIFCGGSVSTLSDSEDPSYFSAIP